MKKFNIKAALLVILFSLFLPFSLQTRAASELPSGLIIFDSDGISAEPGGRYFLQADELRPGDFLSKQVTLQNINYDKAYSLSVQTEPTGKFGNINLFEEIEITINYESREIYRGSADGQGTVDLTKPVTLQSIYPNQSREMEILIYFKTENREKLVAGDYGRVTFNLIFTATRDGDYKPPKTGLATKALMYIITGAISFVCCILLLIKHKKAAKKEVAS